MINQHQHFHKPVTAIDRGWTLCVSPRICANDPRRETAHGNITRHEVCSCGAIRKTEINGGMKNYGRWEKTNDE